MFFLCALWIGTGGELEDAKVVAGGEGARVDEMEAGGLGVGEGVFGGHALFEGWAGIFFDLLPFEDDQAAIGLEEAGGAGGRRLPGLGT